MGFGDNWKTVISWASSAQQADILDKDKPLPSLTQGDEPNLAVCGLISLQCSDVTENAHVRFRIYLIKKRLYFTPLSKPLGT